MKTLTFFTILILESIILFAQEDNQYGVTGIKEEASYAVIRHDGVEYVGKILSDDNREILLDTKELGLIYIHKTDIKSIVELNGGNKIVFNEYQPVGPFTTRYSFTTNALPIKKGENYAMLNLHGPEAHIALTDHLNIGIMTTWIASPLLLATKYSFTNDESKVNFSAGTLLGSTGYLNGFKGYGGLHWLNMTLGDRQNNITLSAGYAYLQTGFKDEEPPPGVYSEEEYNDQYEQHSRLYNMTHGPIVSLAGLYKIGAKSSFIFDSMIGYFNFEQIDTDYEYNNSTQQTNITVTKDKNAYTTALFLMPGVRFQKTDRTAFQICVAGVSTFGDADASFPIPMCTWFYRF